MKKLYAFLITFCLAGVAFGQTYLSEDFSSGQMPPTGWTIENLTPQWSVSSSNEAGGVAPEAKFTYIQGTTTTRLITSTIDLTGVTSVTLMFSHFYDWYANPAPKVGVATRSGGGNWNTVWEITPTGNVGPETKVLTLNNSDVGKPDFQLCFYLNGNMYNLDYWFLDDILLFNPYATDAMLTSISLPQYVANGASAFLKGVVKNQGSNNITSFDVSYTIAGGAPVVCSITGIDLALGESYNFTHDVPIVLTESGSYPVDVTVDNVNGGIDEDPSNNSLSTQIGCVPWIPEKKVIGEEATGTWCGWCVRGICYMDYMAETYPDTWIGVAVHNGDPMVNAAYDDAIPNIIPNFPGYPSGTIDRSGDNYYDPEQFEEGYLERINAISPGTVEIYNFSWNPDTRVVSFDVKSEFVVDVANELRFGAIIIEDSLYGTGSTWGQANYYSGGGYGPMCGFESLPNPIPAANMHYDHVAREILDTPYGTPNSIAGPVTAGSVFSHTYTYTIPAGWNFDKLTFVGLLLDNVTGEIMNCNNEVFWVGIPENNYEIGLKVYPNPVTTTANIGFKLDQASDVSIRVTDLTGRTMMSIPAKKYPVGENKVQVDAGSMNSGCYVVEVTVNNKAYSQKLSVVK